mmetsp:Transcript_24312/g.50701  ORF Transcript_24312/g.50701 Transcript_24312/m.50701 type:complete len:124 (+) Transcript_24312:1212-1583(+)
MMSSSSSSPKTSLSAAPFSGSLSGVTTAKDADSFAFRFFQSKKERLVVIMAMRSTAPPPTPITPTKASLPPSSFVARRGDVVGDEVREYVGGEVGEDVGTEVGAKVGVDVGAGVGVDVGASVK